MDFKKLSLFILAGGAALFAMAALVWTTNQPLVFDPEQHEKGPFGFPNIGAAIAVEKANVTRKTQRENAGRVMVLGAIITFVGIAVFFSAKETRPATEVIPDPKSPKATPPSVPPTKP